MLIRVEKMELYIFYFIDKYIFNFCYSIYDICNNICSFLSFADSQFSVFRVDSLTQSGQTSIAQISGQVLAAAPLSAESDTFFVLAADALRVYRVVSQNSVELLSTVEFQIGSTTTESPQLRISDDRSRLATVDGSSRVVVFDIHDPANVQISFRLNEDGSFGNLQRAAFFGSNYIVVSRDSKLAFINIQNPQLPYEADNIPLTTRISDFEANSQQFFYSLSNSNVLKLFAKDASLMQVAEFALGHNIDDV